MVEKSLKIIVKNSGNLLISGGDPDRLAALCRRCHFRPLCIARRKVIRLWSSKQKILMNSLYCDLKHCWCYSWLVLIAKMRDWMIITLKGKIIIKIKTFCHFIQLTLEKLTDENKSKPLNKRTILKSWQLRHNQKTTSLYYIDDNLEPTNRQTTKKKELLRPKNELL